MDGNVQKQNPKPKPYTLTTLIRAKRTFGNVTGVNYYFFLEVLQETQPYTKIA